VVLRGAQDRRGPEAARNRGFTSTTSCTTSTSRGAAGFDLDQRRATVLAEHGPRTTPGGDLDAAVIHLRRT
jgi:hypothetical protein